MNSKILFESILKESGSNLKESVILHFNLEDGTHKALPFSSEEEALDYMDSDEFPAGEWVGDYEIEVIGETEYKVLKLEDAERLEELPKIKKRLSKVQTSISKPSFDSERDEMKWIYKQAAKKSKVKILDSYTKSKKLWSVTLDTEDEYAADNFRDAIDDLLGENSGAHSFDDIIGLGSVHIGVTTAAGEERMHGGDSYEDLDPSIRDKCVVYCEPAEQYKQRREMDW